MNTVQPQATTPVSSPLDILLQRAQRLPPVRAAVVDPFDPLSLGGALAAAERGLIEPVLIGDDATIRSTAAHCGWKLGKIGVVPSTGANEAAIAASLAAGGAVEIVMKGALHSDALLHAILAEPGLLRGRRLSHVVVTEMPGKTTPSLLSDGAVNIAPDLDQKAEIVQNAIDVAKILGMETPRVAILAAVETVVSSMNATLDAAVLSEMGERGQISGGIVDGPLALDDAICPNATIAKGIHSAVAGCADILISPNLEAGNILYKAFDVLLHARFGAVIAGASIPIVFTSRADSVDSRMISCAIARLLIGDEVHGGRTTP